MILFAPGCILFLLFIFEFLLCLDKIFVTCLSELVRDSSHSVFTKEKAGFKISAGPQSRVPPETAFCN